MQNISQHATNPIVRLLIQFKEHITVKLPVAERVLVGYKSLRIG